MSNTRLAGFALAAAFILGAGCSRDAASPTQPGEPARLQFVISTTSSHTLRTVKLTFDGRDVAKVDIPGGGGQVSIEGTVSADRGAHTIGLVIVDQASSPNQYFAGGSITTPSRILDLAPMQGVLATGETLEFRVVL